MIVSLSKSSFVVLACTVFGQLSFVHSLRAGDLAPRLQPILADSEKPAAARLGPDVVKRLSVIFDPEADSLARRALARIRGIDALPAFHLEYELTTTQAESASNAPGKASWEEIHRLIDDPGALRAPSQTLQILSRNERSHDGAQAHRQLAVFSRTFYFAMAEPFWSENRSFWNGQESLSLNYDRAKQSWRVWRTRDFITLDSWPLTRQVETLASGDRPFSITSKVKQAELDLHCPAERVRYRFEPDRQFAGTKCAVLRGMDKSETLFIERGAGHLLGVAVSALQGDLKRHYWQVAPQRLGSPEFSSRAEYGDWIRSLPVEERILAVRDCAYYMVNESGLEANPGSLRRFSNYVNISKEVALPKTIESLGSSTEADHSKTVYSFGRWEMTKAAVEVKPEAFQPFQPQAGYKVYDRRFGPLIQYAFRAEMVQSDFEDLVSQARLKNAEKEGDFADRLAPLEKLIGQPAPDLAKAEWLDKGPERSSKSYILHFWADWCGPCVNDIPTLNILAKKRLVIGIHAPGTALEKVREAVTKKNIQYPVALAPKVTGDLVAGYPVSIYPYAILVDAQGRVAAHGSLDKVLAAERTLGRATTYEEGPALPDSAERKSRPK